MKKNDYLPFASTVLAIIPHTAIEYTFRMAYQGEVKPGQFFEVSIPKFGEAPISVSGIGDGYIDLTIRRVGLVTNEIFEQYEGSTLWLRGPYGNGFDLEQYKGKELIIIAGGTGLSPVRGIIDYFYHHPKECKSLTLIAGFKSPEDILFQEDITHWKTQLQVTITVDQAPQGSCYPTGLVTTYIPYLAINHLDDIEAIVVGPPVMMKFTILELLKRGISEHNIWVSQERKMCCGLGKCGHCRINDVYVCLDGPVFQYTKSKQLID